MDDSLSFESFFESSKKAAHKAMHAHADGEYDDFALQAGVAIERLAKAVLVSKNPLYIAEMRGSAEMLFHLGGHRQAKKVRTIGATEAIDRCRTLGVLGQDSGLDLLIDLRNGVAHGTTGGQAKRLLPALVETVETMHQDLGEPTDAFWEHYTSTARFAVDRKRTEISREVQIRIRQARHIFNKRFDGLPAGSREHFLEAQGQLIRYTMASDRETLYVFSCIECPSCSGWSHAVMKCVQDEPPMMAFKAHGVACSFCGLEIDGVAEIQAADLDVHGLTSQADRALAEAYSIMTGQTLERVVIDGAIRLKEWVPLWRHDAALPQFIAAHLQH